MSDEVFVRDGSFTSLWRNITNVCDNNNNKTPDRKRSETRTPDMRKDLQSPQRRDYCRYPGLNYGDSPSDVEPTQDIIWDATSPTLSAKSLRGSRIVEVADIVNRIAPTDVKPKCDSPLLQWIGDSAIPGTPEIPKPRARKKSSRQSSVDLMLLARQFDQNMQQEIHTSEQQKLTDDELGTTPKAQDTADSVQTLQCSSASDKTEAELHALFDCSTQCVSGRLSQGNSTSGYSQELRKQPVEKSDSKSLPAQERERQNYDDDWENDDILNDSFVLEMTQDPENNPARSNLQDSESELSLRELRPKTKTSTRSTFRLQSNPDFQHAVKNQKSSHGPKSAARLSPRLPESDKKSDAGSDVLDSVWDDDDELLCQACDSVEQNIQPQQQKLANLKTTTPLPIDRPNTTRSAPFLRSNSLPETHCGTMTFQGWDVPMRGAGRSRTMSHSLPADQLDGTFIQQGHSPRSYRVVDLEGKLHEVTTRPTLNAKPHSFKRNLSDSAVSGNKVFITSQRGECSAAEIEKKKQDAQARRRLRMQNQTKP